MNLPKSISSILSSACFLLLVGSLSIYMLYGELQQNKATIQQLKTRYQEAEDRITDLKQELDRKETNCLSYAATYSSSCSKQTIVQSALDCRADLLARQYADEYGCVLKSGEYAECN